MVPKTGGMNTTKVTVVRWIKNEGETFKQGEPIVELETEKVSYELDAPEDGVLLKILVREPAEVDVGGTLGFIGKPGDKVPRSVPETFRRNERCQFRLRASFREID